MTETFAFKTKYFYDEANLQAFREEYAAMRPHQKAMENPVLAGGGILAVLGVIAIGLLLVTGGV